MYGKVKKTRGKLFLWTKQGWLPAQTEKAPEMVRKRYWDDDGYRNYPHVKHGYPIIRFRLCDIKSYE